MSSFRCEHCGTDCLDSPHGYTTGCEHYLPDTQDFKGLVNEIRGFTDDPMRFLITRHVYLGCSPLQAWNKGELSHARFDLWSVVAYENAKRRI